MPPDIPAGYWAVSFLYYILFNPVGRACLWSKVCFPKLYKNCKSDFPNCKYFNGKFTSDNLLTE